ncbi:PPE domain-containing protein [Nocardia asteroides]|uniref:PPE domain-containing protein n=1 Tax=Nocardia asteroides TaxID=1824 RepID=UPI00364B33F0
MPLPLIALAVVAVAAVAAEGEAIYDNYSTSHDEAKARGDLGTAANDAVSGDRTIIESERARLESGFDGTYAKAELTGKLESFSTLSHQEIWDALNGSGDKPGVSAGEINAGADGWRRLVTGMSTAVTDFRTKIDTAINQGWSGNTANAAIDGVRAYASEAEKLPTTFQMVANGIDLMEGALLQAKMAIDKPKELSWDGKLTAWIPDGGLLKDEQYRIDEAERAAQEILERVYKPQAVVADEKTPVLAVPKNTIGEIGQPADDGNGGATNNNNGNGDNGTTSNDDQAVPQSTLPQSTDEETTSPSTEDTGDDAGDDTSGEDDTTASSTTPGVETTPTGTTPGTTTPGTTPGGPGSGGGPGGGGSPGLGTTSQNPTAGRPVAGTPAGNQAAAAAAGRGGAAGGRGMSGMPGMMGGGGRGAGTNNDDDEHTSPDYLIQDRESELIGELPPTLPPGGVIGG